MEKKTDIDFSQGVMIRTSDGKYIVHRPSGPWDVWPNTDYMADVETWIAEGGVPYPEPTPPAPTPEELIEREIAEKLALLASTDWYVVRFAETGVAIPAEVTTARSAARARIDDLRG